MVEFDRSLAPGCYGVALAFKVGSAECSSCAFQNQCQPESEKNLALVRAKLGISPPSGRRNAAPAPAPAPEVKIAPPPVQPVMVPIAGSKPNFRKMSLKATWT